MVSLNLTSKEAEEKRKELLTESSKKVIKHNLSFLFIDTLIKQLDRENMLTIDYENYLRKSDQIVLFCTTDNDRKTLGSMNDFIYHVKNIYSTDKNLELTKKYVWLNLNQMPSGVLSYQTPREAMSEHIKTMANNK